MIGAFAVQPERTVQFLQMPPHTQIKQMRLVDGGCVVVECVDGTEDMFTAEIDKRILDHLLSQDFITVSEVDFEGSIVRAYSVLLDRGAVSPS